MKKISDSSSSASFHLNDDPHDLHGLQMDPDLFGQKSTKATAKSLGDCDHAKEKKEIYRGRAAAMDGRP